MFQNNRILNYDSQYCSQPDKDSLFCLECDSRLTLPSCQTCPLGFYFDKNGQTPCQKCKEGQILCQTQQVCYKGYTAEYQNNELNCKCDNGYIAQYTWCQKNSNEFYYQSSYERGEIVNLFSSEILLIKLSPDKGISDEKNCGALKDEYSLKSKGIKCSVGGEGAENFIINLDNVKLTADIRDKIQQIPTFNTEYLAFRYQGEIIFNPVLKYQETSLSINQVVFNTESQVGDRKCEFKTKIYKFLINQKAVIPSDHFLIEGFASVDIEYKLQTQNNQKNVQDVLSALKKYPAQQFEVQMDSQFTIDLVINCILPFGLISQSSLQIQTLQKFDFKYEFEKIEPQYNIGDKVKIQFKNMEQNNGIADEKDTFILSVLISYQNSQNYLYTFNKELSYLDIKDNFFVQIIDLNYPPGDYVLQICVKYFTEESFSYEIKPDFKLVSPLDFYSSIENNLSEFNPRDLITINSKIISEKYKDEKDYTYEWSCYEFYYSRSCADKFQNNLVFSDSNQITIPIDSFDFNNRYDIKLRASLLSDQNIFYESTKIYYTQKQNLYLQYDRDYARGVRPDQLLTYNLEYDDKLLLQRNEYQHYFQIESKEYPVINSKAQIEPQFYFRLNEYYSKEQLNKEVHFMLRFFVKDSNNKISLVSEKSYILVRKAPSGCEIEIEQLNGNEKAFTDLITISVKNCYTEYGSLFYLFMYYNKDDLQQQEQADTDYYKRRYLTKFIDTNQISTILPPGNIVFQVLVKDELQTTSLFSKNIQIQKAEFDMSNYSDFLETQVENLRILESDPNNKKFEEVLCSICMIIECMVDFESTNDKLPNDIMAIKQEDLLKRLLNMPFLIPNDQHSQQLQEYVLRCLDQLLKSKYVLSSQIKFDQLYKIIEQQLQSIDNLNLSDQDVRDTYKRQMFLALDMVCQYIQDINKIQQDTKSWNKQQLQVFENIQNTLMQTLEINQQNIEWECDYVSILVHKVDSQILIKKYLKQSPTNQVYYDQSIYHHVKKQYWSTNLYSNEDQYKEQVTPFYKNVTDNIKQELDRTYPAINFDISSSFKQQTRRFLKQTDLLVLPDNSHILYQFEQIKGNGVVVCTQKIKEVWSTKQCKTSVEKKGDKYNVVCTCPEPTYTTLVYDLKTLFDTENAQDIFSEEGIQNIFSLDNWYEYAAIYTIILINIGLLIGLKLAVKKDKLGMSSHGNLLPSTPLITITPQLEAVNEDENFTDLNKQNKPVIESSLVTIQNDKNKLDVGDNKERCHSEVEILKKQTSAHDLCIHSNSGTQMNELITKNQICLNMDINDEEVKKQQQFTQNEIEIRKLFVESENKGQHSHIADSKISSSKDKKQTPKMTVEKCNEIKKKCSQYLKQLPKFKAIGVFHSLFQIFFVFNDKSSRVFRMCIYYSKLVWLLAINATFGKNISVSQVILLSVICSITFGIYKFIFQMLLKNKITTYISYFLFVCFVLFCYYAILVSISNSLPSDSNIWILSYFCSLLLNVLIIEIVTSFVKLVLTNKLILTLQPTSIVFSILGADAIIQMFQ